MGYLGQSCNLRRVQSLATYAKESSFRPILITISKDTWYLSCKDPIDGAEEPCKAENHSRASLSCRTSLDILQPFHPPTSSVCTYKPLSGDEMSKLFKYHSACK